MIKIRKIQPEEVPVLDEFLFEAIFIPQGAIPPSRSIIEQDELRVYVRDFGKSSHDYCLVADSDGKIVGAVWVRIMDDYGHLDSQTPSLAISLYKEYRGQGIGTQLLHQMMDLLRKEKYAQVSLSVQKENYALRMYEKAGFKIVEDRGEEVLMVARL
ncbi:MAG: GNAT family N-acetyltransferase [Paludibacteraceae bacterium]|nr:GNAT family N-acetyltransferase [Paludibacteraceae bacterium]